MNANIAALGKMVMGNRIERISQLKLARIAGLLYLIIIVSGIFAEFFVRQSLKVPGDAAATASNIMASEMLFRAGIAGDLIMIVADIALALVFYLLFRPVSNALALLAAFFRLAQAIILGINLLNLFFALQLFEGTGYLSLIGADQLQALGMVFLDAHGIGYTIGLTFFAINLLILAYLVFKSGYFPRILGVLLVVAAVGYLIDSFAKVLLSNYAAYQPLFDLAVFVPAFIAELAFCLWLIIKGVNIPQLENNPLNTAQAEGIAD
jgi:hypothetical protein